MLNVDISHSFWGTITVGLLLVAVLFLAQTGLRMVRSIPEQYYNTLPVSSESDYDRDGIPDHIDDSDGDGIPDAVDPVPFKDAADNLMFKRAVTNDRILRNR